MENTLQNWHGTQEKMAGQPIDFGALLKQLITPTANPQDAQNALGPATLKQVGASGKTASDAVGPYQEGVAKALKDLGQQHVQEAVAQGADPVNDIQNHHMMQQSSQSPEASTGGSIDPNQLLAGLLAVHLANQPVQSSTNSKAKSNYGSSNPVTDFFAKLGITPTPSNQVLLSQAVLNRQKLAGEVPVQPADQASQDLLKSQSGEILQRMLGQVPIQPYEAATLRAGQNTAQVTALKDTMEGLQKRRDDLNTEFEAELKTMTASGKLMNLVKGQNMTPRMTAIRKEQSGIDRVLAKTQAKLSGFMPINPMAAQGNHSPQQIAQYNALRSSGVSADEARKKAGL